MASCRVGGYGLDLADSADFVFILSHIAFKANCKASTVTSGGVVTISHKFRC